MNNGRQNGFYERFIKRPLDFLLSGIALLLLSWLFAGVALLVRVKLGSPVIYKQARPGKDGKIFNIYKFRTMTDARDSEGNLLPDVQRLTPFGRKLRDSSLDELPEIANIFMGDMALVGPRPLLVKYLPLYNEHQPHRHDVRPGLTGLAQINGRNVLSWEEKFDYDVEYVNNVTFAGDLKIFFKTISYALIKKNDIDNSDAKTVTIEEFKGTGAE